MLFIPRLLARKLAEAEGNQLNREKNTNGGKNLFGNNLFGEKCYN